MPDFGRLEKVELRKGWKNEAAEFTPWLAQEENLKLLGEALGMALELKGVEEAVGPFRADILCRDKARDILVLVENQLERTDHTHLGQIITYAAGLDTAVIVWIASSFTPEHRASLDWLNAHTDEEFSFFGLEVELWRIGTSPVAPKFNIVCQPDNWARDIKTAARRSGQTEHQKLQQEYWTLYVEYMADSRTPCDPAGPFYYIEHPLGTRVAQLYSAASARPLQLRTEFAVQDDSVFTWFEQRKSTIESELGEPLTWDRETYSGGYCRVYLAHDGDMRERDKWPEQHKWLREHVEKMYEVFKPLVQKYEATQRQ